MKQYIDKFALVEEIKKLKKMYCYDNKTDSGLITISVFESINNVIDILEVKEVDLEKEIKSYFKGFGKFPSVGIDDCIDIAKHFFELGIKAQKGE